MHLLQAGPVMVLAVHDGVVLDIRGPLMFMLAWSGRGLDGAPEGFTTQYARNGGRYQRAWQLERWG